VRGRRRGEGDKAETLDASDKCGLRSRLDALTRMEGLVQGAFTLIQCFCFLIIFFGIPPELPPRLPWTRRQSIRPSLLNFLDTTAGTTSSPNGTSSSSARQSKQSPPWLNS